MLISKVGEYIRRRRLIRPGERVLAAFSGGPDSVALLHILHELATEMNFRLEALHVNHHARPVESDLDESFCRAAAARLGRPIRVEHLDMDRSPGNLEERWRLERQAVYRRCLAEEFDRVALGHTRDDQAETVLMRLCRGAGRDGLGGMSPAGPGRLIRPLLAVNRAEIMQFLGQHRLEYRSDLSNQSPEFLRNRIRHRVVPVLQEPFHPQVARVIARSGAVLREEAAALHLLLRRWLDGAATREPDALSLPAGLLLEQPAFLRPSLVREALREVRGHLRGLSRQHVLAVLSLAARSRSGSRLTVPGGLEVRLDFGRLRIGPPLPAAAPFCYRVVAPARITIPETGERFRVDRPAALENVPGERFEFPFHRGEVVFRNTRPGDRIACGGGHKKLKKLFQERRVPAYARSRATLVADGGGQILWIPKISWSLCYNNSCQADGAETITVVRLDHDCT